MELSNYVGGSWRRPRSTSSLPVINPATAESIVSVPMSSSADVDDAVAMFTLTCGQGVRARARELQERGEYLRSHALQALAIEGAEAFAEMLHTRLRTLWGFPDPPDLTIADKLKGRYRGLRVSFGYPACPELADQATLWKLLVPEQIGISLTESYMMDPEASVSALVFHHPEAKYFKAE